MRERIISIIKSLGVTQKQFASEIGITAGGLTDYIKGRSKDLSGSTIQNVANKFNINPTWLLTGEGEMFMSSTPSSKAVQKSSLSDRDREMVDVFAEYLEYRSEFLEYRSSKVKEFGSEYSVPKPVKVPLLGSIAAGVPIVAEENCERVLHIPRFFLPRVKEEDCFALRVRGESMVGACIADGDIAVLEKVRSPREQMLNGDIGAVLINNEATLKRVCFVEDSVELRAENPRFKTMVLDPSDINLVQGRLILSIREFEHEPLE